MDQTMDTTHQGLESRLDTASWGLFLLMSGVAMLLPGLPDGSWLIGVGAILLGLSDVRFWAGLPVSGSPSPSGSSPPPWEPARLPGLRCCGSRSG